jgi:glycosyltransferase involved in cell wall biosynthesis
MKMKGDASPYVSVVLCTYNRVELLDGALRTLCHQLDADDRHEVIVVDNNSSDKTKECTLGYSDRFEHLRYVFEKRQGLSHARNRGLREARGEYIAFVDDDCEVPDDYIVRLLETLYEVKPAVLGGPAYPLYKTPKPGWYKDEYAQYTLTDQARPLNRKEYAYGFNMVYRRACLESVGGFDPGLGMSGDDIGYGEDIVPQRHIREKMPDEVFYYDPRVRVYHLVRPEKMTLRWNMQSKYHHGIASNKIFVGNNAASPGRITILRKSIVCIFGMMKDAVTGIFTRDRKVYPYYQNYLYEHTFEYLGELGRLHGKYHVPYGQSTG